ncbi:MAG: glycosyltransferase family 39 protein [Solirubrobacteraceae bacterium]
MIAIPAVLAAVLGVIGLESRSLGFDEGATVAIVSQHGSALGAAIARDGGNMSGYYLLMHLFVGWFGDGLAVLRLPSVVFTVVTVALVGVLGVRLFNRRVGFVAGLLTAVNLPLVYWAQTARGYAPMVTFVCAGWVAFLSLADERTPQRRRRLAWLGYVAAMALAAYASFVAVLVIPVQLLAVVCRPRAARRLVGALAALAVCCLPLLILGARRGSGQLFWVPRPSRKVEGQVLEALTSTGLKPSFHPPFTTTGALIATIVVLLGLAGAVIHARRAERAPPAPSTLTGWPIAITLSWILVPALLTFAYSLLAQPIFLPRNLLTSLPAVALALGVVITHPRLSRPIALVALVVALAVRAVPLIVSYGVSPEPWQTVTAQVLARARPGDCVSFYPQDARNAFQYYVGRAGAADARRAPRSILPAIAWDRVEPFVERYASLSSAQLSAAGAGCRRMWLVSSHEGQTDGPARSLANLALYHRLEAELQHAFGPGPVQQFGYASAIHVRLLAGQGRRRPG